MRKLSAKRRLPFSICLIGLWFTLVAPAVAKPPAFEILQNGKLLGYLVGTMHTDDPRVMSKMHEIEPLLDQVDVVAIEMVPDGVAMMAVGAATLLPAGQRLATQIGEKRFLALTRAADLRGLEPALLDRLKPWAAAVVLGVPAMPSGEVLDTAIYLAALARGHRVLGLESAAEQVAVFDSMAPALQLALLDAMIKNATQLPMQLEDLTAAYLSGDVGRIMRVARAQYHDVPPEISYWFERELLDRRNARMLMSVAEILGRERLLVAVGAMHLGGDSGLIRGLEELGFAVRPVFAMMP